MNISLRYHLFLVLMIFGLHAEPDPNLTNTSLTDLSLEAANLVNTQIIDNAISDSQEFDFNTNAPIFKAFPGLQETLPHITLGTFPTPILKADKFGVFLKETFDIDAKNIYIKQDNFSGRKSTDGTQLFGGIK